MSGYRTTKDIVIPAGTEVTKEPPHERKYHYDSGTIVVDVGMLESHVELVVDFDDALEQELIKEIGEAATP